MKVLLAGILFVIAGALVLAAFEALKNIWGYQDSPVWVYLAVGVPELLLAALAAYGGFSTLRSR